jgi:hypothetical protein
MTPTKNPQFRVMPYCCVDRPRFIVNVAGENEDVQSTEFYGDNFTAALLVALDAAELNHARVEIVVSPWMRL